MTKITKAIDFQQDSGEREIRSLRDFSDRVLQGDPHHERTVFFTAIFREVVAGAWTSKPEKW